jgi:hypothetical protein
MKETYRTTQSKMVKPESGRRQKERKETEKDRFYARIKE